MRSRPRPDLRYGQTWLQVVREHSLASEVAFCFAEVFKEEHLVACLQKKRITERFQIAFPRAQRSTPRQQIWSTKRNVSGASAISSATGASVGKAAEALDGNDSRSMEIDAERPFCLSGILRLFLGFPNSR